MGKYVPLLSCSFALFRITSISNFINSIIIIRIYLFNKTPLFFGIGMDYASLKGKSNTHAKYIQEVRTMNRSLLKIVVTGFMIFFLFAIGTADSRPLNQAKVLDAGNRPLYFIPNQGQFHEHVAYCARAAGYTLWITADGITFDSSIELNSFRAVNPKRPDLASMKEDQGSTEYTRQVLRTSFSGINENVRMIPLDETDHHVNYFMGKNSNEWRKGIPTSRIVLYQEIYPKIDLKVSGKENTNTYEFIIKPGGDVRNIEFIYEGCGEAIPTGEGNLTFETGQYALQHKHPAGYLFSGENKQPIDVKFRRMEADSFGFYVDPYDEGAVIVIQQDIAVSVAKECAGSFDMGYKIVADSSGGI
ncbi:MAG: hypothetical protein MUP70_17035, partial [Candidatus Aminicenantes bacterium]|nr:hypothetical protein [Candidatus Aminicenantes bacterium]